MYEKVTKQMIEECTRDLQFYDENGHFSWEKKKVLVSLSYKSLEKLKGKRRSKEIELLLN